MPSGAVVRKTLSRCIAMLAVPLLVTATLVLNLAAWVRGRQEAA